MPFPEHLLWNQAVNYARSLIYSAPAFMSRESVAAIKFLYKVSGSHNIATAVFTPAFSFDMLVGRKLGENGILNDLRECLVTRHTQSLAAQILQGNVQFQHGKKSIFSCKFFLPICRRHLETNYGSQGICSKSIDHFRGMMWVIL